MAILSTKKNPIPWQRFSAQVDEQIKRGIAAERAAGRPMPTVVNGALVYQDGGSSESYTVGYGGERNYSAPAPRPAAKPAVNGASEKQSKFIDDLIRNREHNYTGEQVEAAKADWRLTRKMIDSLMAAPRRVYQAPAVPVIETPAEPVRTRLNFAEIPDGNYAIRQDGVIKFYRVSTSKKGFKDVQVRASQDLFMQFGSAGIAILHRIVEAGLKESQMLFATELKHCWMCNLPLTDQESRDRGTGPICAEK